MEIIQALIPGKRAPTTTAVHKTNVKNVKKTV